jgi:type III secretory pathway component EscV
MEKSPMNTQQNSEEKKPAIGLWLLCHVTLVVFPLALVISNILMRFGIGDNVLALLIGIFLSFQIISMYSTLDYEVTNWVLKKRDSDD